MPEQTFGLGLIGLAAGVMSGMFGIGGGAIIVPALILFLGFDQKLANGTSLAALLLPVGVFAVMAYYQAGKLKLIPSLAVALGLTLGAWAGAGIALDLDPTLLRQSYGAFLLVMSWRYIAPRQWLAQIRGEKIPALEEKEVEAGGRVVFAVCLAIGGVAGVFSGLFGIGGGVVIVPALMNILRFDQKLANGTSLGALLMPVGLFGALRYYEAGKLDLLVAVPLAVGLVIGAFFGAKIALGLSAQTVRRLYGFFLLFVGIRFLFNL